ncbi:MAG: cysteine-rich CWC family protein [Rhodocyclaceae bacterium]|nr:cysteine-rich CWC family protein [Rhodocyclaceae bacterium]
MSDANVKRSGRNQKSALAERRPAENVCPACGNVFTCGMAAGAKRCWCTDLPPLPKDALDSITQGCFCPTCLASRSKSLTGAQQA